MLNRDDGNGTVQYVFVGSIGRGLECDVRDVNNKDLMVHIYDALDTTSWQVSRKAKRCDESLLQLYSKHYRDLLMGLVPSSPGTSSS